MLDIGELTSSELAQLGSALEDIHSLQRLAEQSLEPQPPSQKRARK